MICFFFPPWGNPLLGESIGKMFHVFKVPKTNPRVATVFPMLGHGYDGDVLHSNNIYIYISNNNDNNDSNNTYNDILIVNIIIRKL